MSSENETWECPDCGHLTPSKFNRCERCCADDVEQPYSDLPAGSLANFRLATVADIERPTDKRELTELERWASEHQREEKPRGY